MFKAGTKPGLVDYNRSNFRQYWMPDSTGKECYQCEERFSTFRRRHHCRLCGQIFCAKCCNVHVPGSALGSSFFQHLRVLLFEVNAEASSPLWNSIRTVLQDEEESGPDWFRYMDAPDVLTSVKDDTVSCSVFRLFHTILSHSFHRLYVHCQRRYRWKPIILKLVKEVAATVKVDVAKRRDNMNIVSYVHVKKLFVAEEEPQAELIWGVVCSKSVVHESMADPLKDASIMIVAGSVEYERVQGRLSTLEPILNQEGEFLSKQVERILSRRPSVLLVEGSVSRLAADLLREAGVRLVVNVSGILHRVARSTGADILPSSDAQLIQQNIGFCPYFAQRTVAFRDGRNKLLLVRECRQGGAICADAGIERIILFLTSVFYSSRLERAFLNMFNIRVAYQTSNCEVCESRKESVDQDIEKSDFEKALTESVLTASPFIDYEPPYLESVRGRNCSLLPYFNQHSVRRSPSKPVPASPRHFYAICGARDADNEESLSSFRVGSVSMFFWERQRSRRHDMLDPYVHQRIAVLFGSFSPKSPNAPYFCVRPWVVNMEFYGPHDMTLGEFLTKFCFNKSYECPSSNCEVPMLDHSRKLGNIGTPSVQQVCSHCFFHEHAHFYSQGNFVASFKVMSVQCNKFWKKNVNHNVLKFPLTILALQANESLMHIREAIYQLIATWNDQIRAANDIGLERIDDPFPSYLHLGLKLDPRVGVVVRDIMDSRGNYKPDIGSIIAYALSIADYEVSHCKHFSLAAEHLEVEFQDNQASYYVKAYYAGRFRLLRKLLFTEGEEAFIRSLSQSTFWTPQGGKSGSFFYRTQDDRFVIKQMSKFEIQSFVEFAPHYFEYVKTAVVENKLTTLCKVYGVFRVGYKSKTTQLKVDILVMEYLFYKHNVNQVWDLKGSLRNRMATTGKSTSDLVLLDENLMKDLWNKQLYIYPHAKAALNQAISNDSHFLSSQHVMDYSLLVGVDETNGELILGIVDYMRTYTLDKKLESWVKIVAIPGAHLPTILSPEMYCTRFSEAIDTYFPVVPDQWTGLGSAVSY
ncbi:unnamed protein product [Heligmosomoides polygyrus]|uniref:1-phosphatidylinositol-3-phosphate 5-kinase n=1 Tax=Heligmosomoides polygyrus TaxID=6339 RepID=A0A183FXE8_HELPZ|nr:unnamed protein product [Heligmosomoides polygyrus]